MIKSTIKKNDSKYNKFLSMFKLLFTVAKRLEECSVNLEK